MSVSRLYLCFIWLFFFWLHGLFFLSGLCLGDLCHSKQKVIKGGKKAKRGEVYIYLLTVMCWLQMCYYIVYVYRLNFLNCLLGCVGFLRPSFVPTRDFRTCD